MKKTKNPYAVKLGKMRWKKYKDTEQEKQRIEKVKEGTKRYWAEKRAKQSQDIEEKLSTS